MIKRLSFLLLGLFYLALPFIVLHWLQTLNLFLFADSAFISFSLAKVFEPIHIVNFSSNAFFSWRFDPLVHLLVNGYGYQLFFILLFVFFAIAVFWSYRLLNLEDSDLSAAVPSAIFLLISLLLYGIDSTVFQVLLWFLAIITILGQLTNDTAPTSKYYFLLTLASLGNIFSANQFALFNAAIAIITVFQASWHQKSRVLQTTVAILLIPAIFSVLFYSVPDFPEYSSNGHLVPYYGVVDGLSALVGSQPPLLILDRSYLRSAFTEPALILLAFSLFALIRSGKGKPMSRAYLRISALLALAVVLDSDIVDAGISQLAPIQSLSRIMPGFFYLPLSPIVFFMSMFLLCGSANSSFFSKRIGGNIWSLAMLLVVSVPTSSNFHLPKFKTIDAEKPIKQLSNVSADHVFQVLAIIQSPSYYLLREIGLPVISEKQVREALSFASISDSGVALSSSLNEADLGFLIDNNNKTRWFTARGLQKGDEWVHLRFPKAVEIAGIRLTTTKFYTDFPRGIEISGSSDCSADTSNRSHYKILYSASQHQGEVLFTPSGHPYYSEQYDMSAYFSKKPLIQCLLIRQIGRNSHFDWSITELTIAH